MAPFAALLRKELLAFLTNWTFVALIGFPVVVSALFGLAFSGERALAGVAVVRPADAALWARLEPGLRALPTIRISEVDDDPAVAADAARAARVSAIVDLRGLAVRGSVVEGRIPVRIDELRPVSGEVVRSAIAAWSTALAGASPISVDVEAVRGLTPNQANIPLWLLTITIVIGISLVPLSLVEEREQRTLRALLVSPVSRELILAAKATMGVAMVFVSCALTLALSRTAVVSPGPLVLGLLAGAIAFIALGLIIAAFAPTQATASPFAGVLLVGMVLPAVLTQTESPAIATLANVLPSTALLSVIRAAVISPVGVADVAPQLAYLVLCGAIGAAISRFAIYREAVVLR